MTGVKLPDLVAPIRKLDLDADHIRQSIAELQTVADALDSLHADLSDAQPHIAPGGGTWDGEAAHAAQSFGEDILTVLKWVLAIVLIIIGLLLAVLAMLCFVIFGLCKLVTVVLNGFLEAAILSIAGLGVLRGLGLRPIIAAVLRVFGRTLFTVLGVIPLVAGLLADDGEIITQWVLAGTWLLLLWAAQLIDAPKSEAVARKQLGEAFKDKW